MKTFWYFGYTVAAALVALGLFYIMGWPWCLLGIAVVMIGFFILLYYKPPATATTTTPNTNTTSVVGAITKYAGYTALVILTLISLSYIMECSFWKLTAITIVGSGLFVLHSKHPRTAEVITMVVLITLAGTWAWPWFKGNFPFASESWPYAKKARAVQVARQIDPGMSRPQQTLLTSLRIQEDKLAKQLDTLMDQGKFDEVTNAYAKQLAVRAKIEAVMGPISLPPAPKPTKVIAAAGLTLPGVTLEINLTNDQVLTVHDDIRQSQSWRYLSFIGAFSHRLDKGDGLASWKLVNNNLPWRADYAGRLQVKAGNTPVKLTVNISP